MDDKIKKRRQQALYNDMLTQLEQWDRLEKQQEKASVDTLRKEMINKMESIIGDVEIEIETDFTQENFDRDILPNHGEILEENDKIILRAISDEEYEDYMRVAYECSSMPGLFKDERYKKGLWEELLDDSAAIYSIIDKSSGEYVGYIGIKELKAKQWEIAIELLKKYRSRGYGYNAMVLLLNAISSVTGERLYRARVEADNYASQGLMKRIGAIPNGVSEMLMHGERLKKFQEENRDLIDDKLTVLAREFGIEPIDLIGRILEYQIEWGMKDK